MAFVTYIPPPIKSFPYATGPKYVGAPGRTLTEWSLEVKDVLWVNIRLFVS